MWLFFIFYFKIWWFFKVYIYNFHNWQNFAWIFFCHGICAYTLFNEIVNLKGGVLSNQVVNQSIWVHWRTVSIWFLDCHPQMFDGMIRGGNHP
jgi:hypothetical protein